MACVVIFIHPTRPDARALATRAEGWLAERGHQSRVLRLGPPGSVTEGERSTPLGAVDLGGSDLAVSIGGDGTFLRLVPLAATSQVPVLGVNFGHLGYLLELQPSQLEEALGRFLAGNVRLEERVLLNARVNGPMQAVEPRPGPDRSWLALNEVVVEKTMPGHTVHLRTSVDGEVLEAVRADGLMVATASGSTAYNLSAGGPVVAPSLRVLLVTPIAPHRSVGRSIVLEDGRLVTLEVLEGRPSALVVDGQEVGRLEPGSAVHCAIAPLPLRLVTFERRPLARALRTVLRPGEVG